MLVFTGHDPRWTMHGACVNILQQSHICMTKRARNWFHEIFFAAIAGNKCSTMTLVSPGLHVRLCLCLQFSPGSNFISDEFESFALCRFLRTCKITRTFAFFLQRHGIDITSLAFTSVYKSKNSQSRTATTNFKTETQTCGNGTTPRHLRDLLIKLLKTTCWQQSIKDN